MGKIQTRRSISIRGETYDRLRAWCESHHESMSELVERLVAGHIGPGNVYRPLPALGVGARAQEERAERREVERRAMVTIPPAAALVSEPSPAPVAQVPAAPLPPPSPAPEFRPLAPTPPPRLRSEPAPAIGRPAESYRPIRAAAPRPRTSIAHPSPLPTGVRVYRDEPAQDPTDHRGIRF